MKDETYDVLFALGLLVVGIELLLCGLGSFLIDIGVL